MNQPSILAHAPPVSRENWKTIGEGKVRHWWSYPDGTHERFVEPTFYTNSGTPMCGEGAFDGDDMVYMRTEVLDGIGAPMSTSDVLALLEKSDSSEAHAMSDCMTGALEDADGPDIGLHEKEAAVRNMLEEFREWATSALNHLDAARKEVADLCECGRTRGTCVYDGANDHHDR